MTAATKKLIRTDGVDVQFLLDAEDSGGSTTVFIARLGPHARTPPAHSHADWDETVYGTEGVITYTIDGVEHRLDVGDALCVRRGQVHRFDNLTDADASMLVVSTPGLFGEDYFLGIAEILNAATDGPPDLGALLDLMVRHGVTPAPPPADGAPTTRGPAVAER